MNECPWTYGMVLRHPTVNLLAMFIGLSDDRQMVIVLHDDGAHPRWEVGQVEGVRWFQPDDPNVMTATMIE